MDAGTIITYATPVIVPLVIAGFKLLKPNIPTWLLPVLAGPLGVLLDFINTYATSHPGNFLVALALGLAGIGVREVVDQLKPSMIEPKD